MEKNKFLQCLKDIRTYEFNIVIKKFNKIGKILEIGAGAGWQSMLFSRYGFDVSAIDIKESNYLKNKKFPVRIYNGKNIPYKDDCFNYIFTSNVLEHIKVKEILFDEMKRVLQDDGWCMHIVPTGTWRFWTNITYYFSRIKYLIHQSKIDYVKNNDNIIRIIMYIGYITIQFITVFFHFPKKHGLKGNFISEIFYFSYPYWKNLFIKNGWKIIDSFPNHLFYTGYLFFNNKLSINMRKKLSYFLGSSCYVFIIKKKK